MTTGRDANQADVVNLGASSGGEGCFGVATHPKTSKSDRRRGSLIHRKGGLACRQNARDFERATHGERIAQRATGYGEGRAIRDLESIVNFDFRV